MSVDGEEHGQKDEDGEYQWVYVPDKPLMKFKYARIMPTLILDRSLTW